MSLEYFGRCGCEVASMEYSNCHVLEMQRYLTTDNKIRSKADPCVQQLMEYHHQCFDCNSYFKSNNNYKITFELISKNGHDPY